MSFTDEAGFARQGRMSQLFIDIDMKDAAEPGSLYVWVSPDSTRGDPAKVEITQ